MWHLDKELQEHWKEMDRIRKRKYGGGGDDGHDADLSDRDENVYADRFK